MIDFDTAQAIPLFLVALYASWRLVRGFSDLRKRSSSDAATIQKLFLWYLVLGVASSFFDYLVYERLSFGDWLRHLRPVLVSPFWFLRSAIPVAVALLWIGRFRPPGFKGVLTNGPEVGYEPLDESALKDRVAEILDSEHFYTSLRQALPRGAEDGEQGLDYVPYMLEVIDEKRKRYESASRTWLRITMIMGLTLTAIIGGFGYVLVNEAAAGTPKYIADLAEDTKAIRQDLQRLSSDGYRDPAFQAACRPYLDRLADEKLPEVLEEMSAEVRIAISTASRSGDIQGLLEVLRGMREKVWDDDDRGSQRLTELLSEAVSSIDQYLDEGGNALRSFGNTAESLTARIPQFEDWAAQPSNRIPELIKRIAIGLVIGSFFLAILRYAAGIYRSHHNELIRTEGEGLSIRKFAVALKSASDSEESKRVVLSSLMRHGGAVASDGNAPTVQLGKGELEALKKMIDLAAKKI